MKKVYFEPLGWFKEYYIDGKFVGTLNCEKDREIVGYYGNITAPLKENITLENGRKIKAGTIVSTRLYPLCGKISHGDAG